jgi:hypothetical protein
MTKLHEQIVLIAKEICCSKTGNLTENIIQNVFLNKLLHAGVYCQKEVVMPVLMDNMFVGHNRFDIMVTQKYKSRTTITILEIKSLSQSIAACKRKERIFEQCMGYRHCVAKMFRKNVDIKIILINIWKTRPATTSDIPYNFDVVNIARQEKFKRKHTLKNEIPTPLKIGASEYFEIEAILDSSKKSVTSHSVLVKWAGFETPSWEPLCNIPVRIKRAFHHVIYPDIPS